MGSGQAIIWCWNIWINVPEIAVFSINIGIFGTKNVALLSPCAPAETAPFWPQKCHHRFTPLSYSTGGQYHLTFRHHFNEYQFVSLGDPFSLRICNGASASPSLCDSCFCLDMARNHIYYSIIKLPLWFRPRARGRFGGPCLFLATKYANLHLCRWIQFLLWPCQGYTI